MRKLIINADDLGYAKGVNEGIIYSHKNGIVTSTSLMINGKAASQGVKLARQNPKLGLGLHFQIEDDDVQILWQIKRVIALALIGKTKKEFLNQVEKFKTLVGKLPDYIDSHHHVHKMPRIFPFIRNWCQEYNVPYRLKINFIDSFFGIPSTKAISVPYLVKILENLPDGKSELMCHPGFVSKDLKSSYSHQRELELDTLTSPEVKQKIRELKIKLINWKEL
jgi:predicted glycoside hydrolase/deacetylase ChbG (UPF0249 family)